MSRLLNWRWAAVVIVAILATAALFHLPELREWLGDLAEWVRVHRVEGAVVVAAIYIPAAVLLVPGSLLTLAAGFALGLFLGTVAVSVGSTLGACAAFWAGRTLARGWIEKKVAASPRFQALDRGVAREGFQIVLLTRLSPVFPFTLLNYAFSLTRVRFRDYALASWLGMLPGTIMYVYLGSAAGNLAELLAGQRTPSPGEQVLFVFGLLATIAVTILITRLARAALRAKAEEISLHANTEHADVPPQERPE